MYPPNTESDRLAQLTAENQKLREALEGCNEMFDTYGHTSESPCERDKEIVRNMLEALATTSAPAVVPREDAEALVTALEACAKKFREYEQIHWAKPDPIKARKNGDMAQVVENTITAFRVKHPKR